MAEFGDGDARLSKKDGGSGQKRKWPNGKQQFGSKGKKKDLGRGDWSRQRVDKRTQNDQSNAKRQKLEQSGETRSPYLPAPFSQEEIDAEARRPKHKVAVMIGYSGSGYHGMQISPTERTIEGDLFSAFVAAGAISKANANDPKKSGLVRCARTDKGVHAAGNVVSLKLIIEDEDIVQKINDSLSPQIRIWGIQRTVGSFSCYQSCDSRWYEYLIPSHSFLPPHPGSFLGKKLIELAEKEGDLEAHVKRQEEVKDFWPETEEKYIKPILDDLDGPVKDIVTKAIFETDDEDPSSADALADEPLAATTAPTSDAEPTPTADSGEPDKPRPDRRTLDAATKRLRAAYQAAKRAHRISPARLDRIQEALQLFVGTHPFHNYTIQKAATDPSAKRHIKSFTLDRDPKIINGTEWLSLKVHGQSFMMHQIRKMVSAATLIVRCGCPPSRINDTFEPSPPLSIPKVPGLGLLLERPVFESYNAGPAEKFGRDTISFDKFDTEMLAFKQREIYERIFREEEEGNAFLGFFGHVDGFKGPGFLWATSGGLQATREEGVGASTNPPPRMERNNEKEDGTGFEGLDSEDESDVEESRQRKDTDG